MARSLQDSFTAVEFLLVQAGFAQNGELSFRYDDYFPDEPESGRERPVRTLIFCLKVERREK